MDCRFNDGRAARADWLLLNPSVKGGDHLGVESDVYGASDSAHVLHEDTIRNTVQMSMRVRTLVDRSSAIVYVGFIGHGRDAMTKAEAIRLATAKAAAHTEIDNDVAAAKTALQAYWAGSATASVMKHYKTGAVREIKAKG